MRRIVTLRRILSRSPTMTEQATMRGEQEKQPQLFSYVSHEDRISQNHPLRNLRRLIGPILQQLSSRFERLYSQSGRPSIAPEYLLRAMVLQILYSIRSERLLMEQLDTIPCSGGSTACRWMPALESLRLQQKPTPLARRGPRRALSGTGYRPGQRETPDEL